MWILTLEEVVSAIFVSSNVHNSEGEFCLPPEAVFRKVFRC